MTLSKDDLLEMVRDTAWPAMRKERGRLEDIDKWYRWEHGKPHAPRASTSEYKELSDRAQTPWLSLVVTAVAQSLYVEGYRRAKEADNAAAWAIWQANGMDSRQVALHRAALAYGLAYMTVLPGATSDGAATPVMRGVSPRRMIAFYEFPADDEWPAYALRCDPTKVGGERGWNLRFYDETAVYYLTADADATTVNYVETRTHNVGVCPVVRFANMLDLEGRANGEVEPLISVAARIDQTIFDRLVVQRFASWVVRTIAGMSAPETLPEGETDEAYRERTKMRLRVEDILVADDVDTKFGSLPASPLDGFIKARDADIRDLAAVSQTPPHHLLGQMANLSAEALAAAEAGLTRKVTERKHVFGESHEQGLRLSASIAGDTDGAKDFSAQVRWRDVESRSLAQVADALGKLAGIDVPKEMLWEQIPNWTDEDVARAKALVSEAGGMDLLIRELTGAGQSSNGSG